MATVNGAQLNKPGLGSSTIGKKNGSKIVPRRLSAANTSLFSNIRVGGQWGSFNMSRANFQNARFGLNAGISAPRTSGVYSNASVARNLTVDNSNTSFVAGQTIGQLATLGLGLLNQFGVIGNKPATTQGAGNKLDNGMSTLNTNSSTTPTALTLSSDVSSHISAMDGATTKDALAGAISDAKGQLGQLDAMKSVYDAAKNAETQKQRELEGQKNTKSQDVRTADSNVRSQASNVYNAQQNRDNAIKNNKELKGETKKKTQAYYNAKDSYVDAQNATERATDAHDRAKTEHDNAARNKGAAQNEFNAEKEAYDKEPETITEGEPPETKPNPNKAKLKAQMDVAQQKLDQAEKAEKEAANAEKKAADAEEKAKADETKAKDAMDNAETAMKDAAKAEGMSEEELQNALESFEEADTALKDAKDNLLEAQKGLDIATENLTQLESEMKSTTGAAELAEANDNNYNTLSRSIELNSSRLAGMADSPEASGKTDGSPGKDQEQT